MPHLPLADVIALPHGAQTYALVMYEDHDGTLYVIQAGAIILDSEPDANGNKEVMVAPGVGFYYEADRLPEHQSYFEADGRLGVDGDTWGWLFASDEDCRAAYEQQLAEGAVTGGNVEYVS